jgi:hypothetical protein
LKDTIKITDKIVKTKNVRDYFRCHWILETDFVNCKFKLFSKNEVEYNFFDNVDMIAVPGGFGDSDSFDTSANEEFKKLYENVKNYKKDFSNQVNKISFSIPHKNNIKGLIYFCLVYLRKKIYLMLKNLFNNRYS